MTVIIRLIFAYYFQIDCTDTDVYIGSRIAFDFTAKKHQNITVAFTERNYSAITLYTPTFAYSVRSFMSST
jgi:hypothetical protein